MAIALAVLSIAIVVLSMYGVLLPHRLIRLVRDLTSGRLGLWSAVTVRLLLAALLWFTAQVSHTPTLFRALAALLFLAAIAHPIVGRARLREFLESLASWPPWAIRLPCLLGVAMGGFLLWAISSGIGAA
jgi:hypothetical protein